MTPEIREHVISLTLTASVAIFFLFLATKFKFFSWKREWSFAHVSFRDVLGAFLTFVVFQLVISPLLIVGYLIIAKKSVELKQLSFPEEAWLGIVNNVILFIVFSWYCYAKREKVKTFFGNKLRINDFFVGVISWLVSMPIASLVGEILDIGLSLIREKAVDQSAVLHLKQTAMYPSLFIVTSLVVITMIPVMEELLFRGFLQTWLKQKLGLNAAILLSSLVFAIFHYSSNQSYDNFLIIGILFTVSCFMGYVYERQKSLLGSIGLHATFNAVTTFSILMSV